jgi:hypothetical protein
MYAGMFSRLSSPTRRQPIAQLYRSNHPSHRTPIVAHRPAHPPPIAHLIAHPSPGSSPKNSIARLITHRPAAFPSVRRGSFETLCLGGRVVKKCPSSEKFGKKRREID